MPVRPLSRELQKKAESELNEVPSRVQGDLKHIREWLAKQPHINARTDDQWLLGFLRNCKFSLQRTKEKLDVFYTMRKLIPEFFANRDPFQPDVQEVLNRGIFIALPKPAHSSEPTTVMIRADLGDPEKISITTLQKTAMMMFEIFHMEDDNCAVSGQYVIYDLKGANYNYIAQLTPSTIKKGVMCSYSAYPTRVKGIYIINAPSFAQTFFKIYQTFVKEKIRNRTHLFNDDKLDELHEIIPVSRLPKEYGGEAGTWDEIAAECKRKVESYRDWFLEDAQYCTIESKRPGKPKISGDMFGVEGSFRKLDID